MKSCAPSGLLTSLGLALALVGCQIHTFTPTGGGSGGSSGIGGGAQPCGGSDFGTCDGGTTFVVPPGCVASELSYCDGGAPPRPALCEPGGVNNELKILVGYSPSQSQTVGGTGQIKVWVNDEAASIIAPGEQVNATNGSITTPGDRTAKAPDGYLWEPAVYIVPQSADKGGTPHFPTAIRGSYNPTTTKGAGINVPGMDSPPAGSALDGKYTTEFVWDVQSLGLTPGNYTAEFVIHDGDKDRAVGCVVINIDP